MFRIGDLVRIKVAGRTGVIVGLQLSGPYECAVELDKTNTAHLFYFSELELVLSKQTLAMNLLRIGDLVRIKDNTILNGHTGVIVGIDPTISYLYTVKLDVMNSTYNFPQAELELLPMGSVGQHAPTAQQIVAPLAGSQAAVDPNNLLHYSGYASAGSSDDNELSLWHGINTASDACPIIKPKCECGVASLRGGGNHSSWCPVKD